MGHLDNMKKVGKKKGIEVQKIHRQESADIISSWQGSKWWYRKRENVKKGNSGTKKK
jgi:hypothetical protein